MIGSEIIVSGSDDRKIKLWYIKTGECIHTLEGHGGSVYCLQVVRNSRTNETLLISGSADESIKIWDLVSGKCIDTFQYENDFDYGITLL
jgi:WD40 repeat protein